MLKDPVNGDYSLADGSPATGYGVQSFGSSIDENSVNNHRMVHNYPNPFNPSATISYNLPLAGMVEITIFNQYGERISSYFENDSSNGKYIFNGENLPSGIYHYNLLLNGKVVDNNRMVLIK